jgi:glycerol-3-phosphate acyltransferase PlsY
MITSEHILFLLISYLTGSFPSAVWVGKIFYNKDVREYGSGNAGATNTFRVLGKKAGIPVLLLDVLKGYLTVNLVWYTSYIPSTEIYINLQLTFGVAAVLGHVFPIYASFRGGKGVATLLGFMLAVFPEAALISIVVFILTLVFSKYVSLSSIFAGLFFPFGVFYLSQALFPTMMIFAIFVPILLISTHQRNIERLVRGDENKVSLKKKK